MQEKHTAFVPTCACPPLPVPVPCGLVGTLGLSYSHILTNHPKIAHAYVDYAPAASYVKLRFKPCSTERERLTVVKERDRKKRAALWEYTLIGPTLDGVPKKMPKLRRRVGGFSRSSQHRLRIVTNSLPATLPLPLFITLTYPGWWPDDPEQWKRDLHTMLTAISRELKEPVIIWKLEPQQRGAPHFHLAVYSAETLDKKWLSRRWYKVVGSRDRRHLRAGTKIERARSRRGALSYIAKYLEKTVAPRVGWEHVGRYWGVWNRPKGMLKRVHLPQRSAYIIRRALWKFRASHNRAHKRTPYRGDAQGTSGYLPGAQVARLITWGLGGARDVGGG